MKKTLKYLMKYAVPLVITVGLCILLFTGFDFKEMILIIRTQCDFRWIAATLAISVCSHIFRAMRWGIQLRALGVNAPLHALIYSIFGTYAVNLVLPRLGEVWRTGYIAERQNAPLSTVFGSMVADRVADTVTVLLLLAATFLVASSTLTAYLGQNSALWAKILEFIASPRPWIVVAIFALLCWWFVAKYKGTRLLRSIGDFVRGLWEGFAVIAKMPGRGRWLVLTLCVWGCYFLQLYLAFFAFPFTAEVATHYGPVAVLVTFVLSSIAMGVPSNGGIGPWQWAVIFALSMYGVDGGEAGAFANLVLGTQTILLILLGIFTFSAIALEKKRIKRNQSTNQPTTIKNNS